MGLLIGFDFILGTINLIGYFVGQQLAQDDSILFLLVETFVLLEFLQLEVAMLFGILQKNGSIDQVFK